jgi:PleD family two-component response regulator
MSSDRQGRSVRLNPRVDTSVSLDEIVATSAGSNVAFISGIQGSSATRLLLVEDNPADAALHIAMLRSTALSELFEIVVVGRLSDCVLALAEEMPACVLLDMGLPDAEGVEGIALDLS